MKLIIVTGQTATGKTKLALEYARKLNGELVNFDSRQIYKHLNIITGKDLDLIKRSTFHVSCSMFHVPCSAQIWLYDVVDPKQYFSSFDFVKVAIPVIKKILKQGKTPILVGGTYFYLYHLLYDVPTQNIKPDWKLRNELNKKSVSELQNMLKKLYGDNFDLSINRSDFNNPRRLIRKIEIEEYNKRHPELVSGSDSKSGFRIPLRSEASKFGMTSALAKKLEIKDLRIDFLGLKFKARINLVGSIKRRVEARLKMGAVEEVKTLLKKGYTENDPGMKTIGYQQIIAYLKGRLTKQEAIDQWVAKEIQYAKRQYTFMKKDRNIKWRRV